MTDEVALVQPRADDLAQWVTNAKHAHELATLLVTTAFVPQSYEGRADQAAAAILTGLELGLSPIASLRSIDVIKGTPAMKAIALRAVVQSNGHQIWTEESTATRAIVAGKRRDSDKVERSTFTIERARQLGLAGRENYRTQPTAMLLARATSECARLVAADALLGIPYSVEELDDIAEGGAEAAPKSSATTKLRRRSLDTVGTADDRRRSSSAKQLEAGDSGSAVEHDDALSAAVSDSDAADSSSATEDTSAASSVSETSDSADRAAALAEPEESAERTSSATRKRPVKSPVDVEMPDGGEDLEAWLAAHKRPVEEGMQNDDDK